MALELDKISFAVDTQALEQATAKVQELTAALTAIGKMPAVTAGGIASTNGSGESKVERGVKRTKKSVEDLQKTLEQTAKDIAEGFSKSEAAVLRNARAMKATDDQVKQIKESLVALRKDADKPVVAPSVTKGVADLGDKVDKVTYTLEKQKIAMDVLRGTTLQLSDGEVALQRVYTNGQANRIAALKLQGASTDQMIKYTSSVKDLNKILGVNPFDQSASGVEKLTKNITELNSVNALMREGLGLTRQQVIALARDIEAERQKFSSLGMSTDGADFAARINQIKQETSLKAKQYNTLIEDAKNADKAALDIANNQRKQQEEAYKLATDIGRQKHIDLKNSIDAEINGVEERSKAWKQYYAEQERASQALDKQRSQAVYRDFVKEQRAGVAGSESEIDRIARANAFLERETQRANNALAGLKGTIEGVDTAVGISTANRLNKYSEELKQAGVSADVAKQKLQSYGNTLVETERLNAEKNKKASMERLDYAARATSVQLGDIGISLAGGQNPLLVMIQQGDQLRAVLAQAALSGEELRKVMGTASRQIVTGFIDVGKALGSFVVGAFKDAGSAAVDFTMNASGFTKFTEALITKVPQAAGSINALRSATVAVTAAFIAYNAIMGGAILIGLMQVIKQENEFARSLALTGGQFKVSSAEAYNYVRSIGAATKDTSAANAAIIEMAKVGGIAADQIELVGIAAVKLSKSVGIPVDETVKKFGELAKEPSKVLQELAKSTGLIDVETLKLVRSYEEAGRKSDAARVATEAYANATKQAADTVKENYGSLTTFAMGVSKVFSSMWDSILGVGRKVSTRETIDKLAKEIADLRDGNDGWISMTYGEGGREAAMATKQRQLDQLYKQVAAEIKVSEQKQEQASLSGKLENFWKSQEQHASNKAKREKEETLYQANNLELLEKKLITQQQYDQGLKDIANKYKDSPVARTPEEKFTDKSIRLFTRDAAEAEGKMNDLTKSQIDLLKIVSSPEWAKADHKKIASAFRDALEIDLENQKMEKQLVLYKQAIEAEKDYVDLLTKRHAENKAALITGMKQIDDAVEIQNDLEFQMKIIGMTADEQKRLTAERKAFLELQKELADIEKKGEGVDKNTLRAYANTAYEQKLKNIGTQSGLDKLIEADKLQQSIADALVTGLTEGGKSGAAKLRNILQAELMKPITVFVRAIVNDISGMMGLGGNSAGGSLMNLAGSFGSSIGSLASSAGSFFGSSSLSAFGAGASGASLAPGLVGPTTAGASGAIGAGSMVGSALTNPYVLGALGLAAGWKTLFGRKVTEQGIQGSYSDGSFSGNNYQFEKGGWFRSNKTSTSALDPAMQQMLASTYKGIDKTFTFFADKFETTVGNSFDAIKVNLMGLSESEAQAKLSEAIAGSVKKTLDAISLPKWAKEVVDSLGDTFSLDSMKDVLAGVTAMKDALDNLGAASAAFAGITSDATSELIAEFGGIQTATQNLASYYQNFYPEEQRIEIATTALNKQLAKLGVTIPSSTAAYKKLVDDALIAGNEELAANLISMSGAFYEVKNAIEAMTSSVIDEANRLRGEIVGSNSSTTLGKNALLAEFGMLTSLARGGDKDAMERLSEVSKQIEDLTKQQAVSQSEVTKMQSYLSQSLYATAQSLGAGLPSYVSASTTNASTSDLSPLTATVQPAGNTASSTAASSQATNAARVEMLLTSLVDNISGLRDEIRADVSHNAKTAKILDRAMQDGQSLTVTVLA
jgi:phage-related minor tail protein